MIDHIKPRSLGGKDDENNYALTHSQCNRSKQDSDLEIARRLHILTKIQKQNQQNPITLEHVLAYFEGSTDILKFQVQKDIFRTSFNTSEEKTYNSFYDSLSKEESIILEIPIKYLYFDHYINPRPINISSISKLAKEFHKGNPQLHLVIGRIDYEDDLKIKIFDGQHKAVTKLILDNHPNEDKTLLIRVFINENNRDRLVDTNKKAGKELAQVAFSANIVRQLQNSILQEKYKQYLEDTHKNEDDNVSESDLLNHFKGYKNFKSLIIDSTRSTITYHKDNQLKDYMSMEGKGKELPLSYSTFSKAILTLMNINYICDKNMNDENNQRYLEINQLVRFCNILSDTILKGKFNEDIGVVSHLENKLTKKQADSIEDNHIIACRLMREEILLAVIEYIKINVIRNSLAVDRIKYNEYGLFHSKFTENLWTNIENAFINIRDIALWKNRDMSEKIFTGKKNKAYWLNILDTGKSIEGIELLDSRSLAENLVLQ